MYAVNKDIIKKEYYIHQIFSLSICVSKLCEYDFYIDNGSVKNSSYYYFLPFIDAYLYKFGMDYTKIPDIKKHNELDISWYKPQERLVNILDELKHKEELVLYHPYCSNTSRSMPQESAIKFLKQFLKKSKNITVISVLNVGKFEDDRYVDLSLYSKTYYDFVYIISRMDKVICTDTSVYHISDAFFIPTVVFFSTVEPERRIQYYSQTRAVKVENKSKNFSEFIFDNDVLSLYKFKGWESIKAGKIIKLLETI